MICVSKTLLKNIFILQILIYCVWSSNEELLAHSSEVSSVISESNLEKEASCAGSEESSDYEDIGDSENIDVVIADRDIEETDKNVDINVLRVHIANTNYSFPEDSWDIHLIVRLNIKLNDKKAKRYSIEKVYTNNMKLISKIEKYIERYKLNVEFKKIKIPCSGDSDKCMELFLFNNIQIIDRYFEYYFMKYFLLDLNKEKTYKSTRYLEDYMGIMHILHKLLFSEAYTHPCTIEFKTLGTCNAKTFKNSTEIYKLVDRLMLLEQMLNISELKYLLDVYRNSEAIEAIYFNNSTIRVPLDEGEYIKQILYIGLFSRYHMLKKIETYFKTNKTEECDRYYKHICDIDKNINKYIEFKTELECYKYKNIVNFIKPFLNKLQFMDNPYTLPMLNHASAIKSLKNIKFEDFFQKKIINLELLVDNTEADALLKAYVNTKNYKIQKTPIEYTKGIIKNKITEVSKINSQIPVFKNNFTDYLNDKMKDANETIIKMGRIRQILTVKLDELRSKILVKESDYKNKNFNHFNETLEEAVGLSKKIVPWLDGFNIDSYTFIDHKYSAPDICSVIRSTIISHNYKAVLNSKSSANSSTLNLLSEIFEICAYLSVYIDCWSTLDKNKAAWNLKGKVAENIICYSGNLLFKKHMKNWTRNKKICIETLKVLKENILNYAVIKNSEFKVTDVKLKKTYNNYVKYGKWLSDLNEPMGRWIANILKCLSDSSQKISNEVAKKIHLNICAPGRYKSDNDEIVDTIKKILNSKGFKFSRILMNVAKYNKRVLKSEENFINICAEARNYLLSHSTSLHSDLLYNIFKYKYYIGLEQESIKHVKQWVDRYKEMFKISPGLGIIITGN